MPLLHLRDDSVPMADEEGSVLEVVASLADQLRRDAVGDEVTYITEGCMQRPDPSDCDNRAVHAMARMMLHKLGDNIQTSWVKLGPGQLTATYGHIEHSDRVAL